MNFKSFDTCLQSKNGEADSICFAVFYYKSVTKSLSMLRNSHFRGLVSRGVFFFLAEITCENDNLITKSP